MDAIPPLAAPEQWLSSAGCIVTSRTPPWVKTPESGSEAEADKKPDLIRAASEVVPYQNDFSELVPGQSAFNPSARTLQGGKAATFRASSSLCP